MKISEWLCKYDGHTALDVDHAKKSFERKTGKKWPKFCEGRPVQELLEEGRQNYKGLQVWGGKPDAFVIGGWQVAGALSHEYVPNKYPQSMGRGQMFAEYVDILRKAGFVFLIGLVMSIPVKADTPLNPDRYVSLGVDYTTAYLPQAFPGFKTYAIDSSVGLYQTDSSLSSNALTLDMRLPVTNWLTVQAHGGNWQETVAQDHSNGYTFGGGVRVYFIGEWFNK